jgi:hypothetical protein
MDEIIEAEVVDAAGVRSSSAWKLPRFSLAALLLWVSATCVVIGVQSPQLRVMTPVGVFPFPATGKWQERYALVACLVAAPLFAVSLVHAVQSVYRLIFRQNVRLDPGHWILFQFAVWIAGAAAATPLAIAYDRHGGDALFKAIQAILQLSTLASAIIAGLGCYASFEKPWRIYFGINALAAGVVLLNAAYTTLPKPVVDQLPSAVGTCLFLLGFFGAVLLSLAGAIVLSIAVIRDLDPKTVRDRLHWLGIAMWCFYVALVVGDTMVFVLVRDPFPS